MANPWWMYPTDSAGGGYGQMIDPVCAGGACHYLKPDTNIAVPAGTPITDLLPGVITDVSNKGAGGGGLSVTEKLQSPLNSLAQYMSFNYLGQADVSVGQAVTPGQVIGVAGSPTGINTAVALGSDPSWGGPGFAQNAVGNPLLNPMQVINAALHGNLANIGSGNFQGVNDITMQSSNSNCPWYCALTPFATWGPCSACAPQNTGSNAANSALGNVNTALGDIVNPAWWGRVGLILIGGVLIIIGVMKLLK